MPYRRPFGTLYRRRRRGKKSDGSPQTGYHPGFYVRITRGGRTIERYAGPNRKTAGEYLDRLRTEADRRELLGEEPVLERTFENAVELYLAWAKAERSATTYRAESRLLNHIIVPFFQGRLLSGIKSVDIQRFLASRPHVKPGTRNRYVSAISNIFVHAKENGVHCKNPARAVRRSKETVIPLPLLSRDQQDALLDRIPEARRPIFVTLLDTGARLSEMIRLEWTDIDLQAGTILIREAKSGRPRVLRATARVQSLLRRLESERTVPLRGGARVFAAAQYPNEELKQSHREAFKQAAAEVGRPKLRIHDLRHLAAINLVRAGMDLPSIKSYLGHRNLISTLRYAEYADDTAATRAARLLDTLHAESSSSELAPGRRAGDGI